MKINKHTLAITKFISIIFIIATHSGYLYSQKAVTSSDIEQLNSNLKKHTVIYSQKDTATLKMDIINKPTIAENSPCILFIFGGGFISGERDEPIYNKFFNKMAEKDFVVVTVDYRLGLKGIKGISPLNTKPLQKAINMAVEDVFEATAYLIKHATELKINPEMIILSGSSAGAITALSADFDRRNNYESNTTLPPTFQYAGVISFAGAIFNTTGTPKYKIAPAPTMMFHGTVDNMVYYKGIRFGKKAFLGSDRLAKIFKKNNYPYYIKRYEDMGHEIAITPMRDDLDEVLLFIDKYIFEGKKYETDINFNDQEKERYMFNSAKQTY